MKAKIYRPCVNQLQSGKSHKNIWLLEYTKIHPQHIDKIMGWYGSNNTMCEIKLKFHSKDAAVYFAKRNKIEYELLEPNENKIYLRSYADNFK